jgi:hypothetical protein
MFDSLEQSTAPETASLADRVAGTPAGPALLALLLDLARRFPPGSRPPCTGPRPPAAASADGWDDELAVRILQGWERMSCWVAAQQQGALVAVAGPTRTSDEDWPLFEVGAALHLAGSTAFSRVQTSRELHGRLAATRGAARPASRPARAGAASSGC